MVSRTIRPTSVFDRSGFFVADLSSRDRSLEIPVKNVTTGADDLEELDMIESVPITETRLSI